MPIDFAFLPKPAISILGNPQAQRATGRLPVEERSAACSMQQFGDYTIDSPGLVAFRYVHSQRLPPTPLAILPSAQGADSVPWAAAYEQYVLTTYPSIMAQHVFHSRTPAWTPPSVDS